MTEYGLPFKGKTKITTLFGVSGSWKCGWHTGVDLVGLEDTTVRAVADGRVSYAGYSASYGNYIKVEHPDGNLSLYAHLAKMSVKKGVAVKRGDALGVMGNTGNSSGAHLHLEIHKGKYKYPTGCTVSQAAWLLDPCELIGMKKRVGVIDVRAEVTKTKILLCGQLVEVERILQDGQNYVKLRDLSCGSIAVDYDAAKKLPTVDVK